MLIEEITSKDLVNFEEGSMTLYNVWFDKNSNKYKQKGPRYKIIIKNKKVVGQWNSNINIVEFKASWDLKLNQAIGDALEYSITKKERESITLKKRTKELEVDFCYKPLFVEPLSTLRRTKEFFNLVNKWKEHQFYY